MQALSGRITLLLGCSMAWLVLLAGVSASPIAAQTTVESTPTVPDPRFAAYDVVSVRPAADARPRFVGLQEHPDGIDGDFATVAMMVQQAYGAPGNITATDALSGLPDWAKSDYFSVHAKMNAEQIAQFNTLTREEQRQARRAMLQALLADRFKVKVHRLSRQVLAYDLVVAKGGPDFKESDTNPDLPDLSTFNMSPEAASKAKGKPFMMLTVLPNGAEKAIFQANPMGQFTSFLTRSPDVDHTVVDKTGLTGKYSFTLTFAAAGGVGPARTATDSAAVDPIPTIFQALEDQLGLRLQRSTATVDTAVVDHVERPTAN